MTSRETDKLFILADQPWTEEELREKLNTEEVKIVLFIRSLHEERAGE